MCDTVAPLRCGMRQSLRDIAQALLLSAPSTALVFGLWLLLDDVAFMGSLESPQLAVICLWSLTALCLAAVFGYDLKQTYGIRVQGVDSLRRLRQDWLDAAADLLAGSSPPKSSPAVKPSRPTPCPKLSPQATAKRFQLTILRLVSLMHGESMSELGCKGQDFAVLDIAGLDDESLRHLASMKTSSGHLKPTEVVMQWIKLLIVGGVEEGVLKLPTPMLAAAIEHFSRGMERLRGAHMILSARRSRKVVIGLCLLQSVLIPFFTQCFTDDLAVWAGLTFCCSLTMWTIFVFSGRLDQLERERYQCQLLASSQRQVNSSLWTMLAEPALRSPCLRHNALSAAEDLERACIAEEAGSRLSFLTRMCSLKESPFNLAPCARTSKQIKVEDEMHLVSSDSVPMRVPAAKPTVFPAAFTAMKVKAPYQHPIFNLESSELSSEPDSSQATFDPSTSRDTMQSSEDATQSSEEHIITQSWWYGPDYQGSEVIGFDLSDLEAAVKPCRNTADGESPSTDDSSWVPAPVGPPTSKREVPMMAPPSLHAQAKALAALNMEPVARRIPKRATVQGPFLPPIAAAQSLKSQSVLASYKQCERYPALDLPSMPKATMLKPPNKTVYIDC